MTDRLHVGTRFVNSCVDPKFRIGATVSCELISFNIELEQIIDCHKRRTHSWRKNEPVRVRDTGAYVSERCRDALSV